MAQIAATDANRFSSSAEFAPMRGFSDCHLQTMLPRSSHRQAKFTPYWQRLELSDGDFIDLAWGEDPAQAKHKPRLVVFHGLEGGLNSPCARSLVEVTQEHGWLGVMVHLRGYSGEPNRMRRIYHLGGTEDASWFLRWLQREFSHAPTAAVGYSLDGNVLVCLLAKEGSNLPVDTAVVVSAPLMLGACNYHMEKDFSRVYQRYLLNLLKANATRKLTTYPRALPTNLAQLRSVRRIREFDGLVTARIHGYVDAIDYHHRCSTTPVLNRIAKPTLVIHARDDPFIDHQITPKPESPPPQVEYQLTEHDGHVGFIGGTLLHPQM